ncbi:MAG: glycosyltransferase family 4 protein [Bacteroidota bacterium]
MQKHSSLLCRYLVQAGIKVDVYHPHVGKGEEVLYSQLGITVVDRVNFFGISFTSIPSFPGHYFWESFQYAKQISVECLERIRNTDLVYAQGFTAWTYIEIRKKDPSLPPVMVNFHGLEMYQATFGIKQKLIQQSFKLFVKRNLMGADYVHSLGGELTDILLNMGIAESKIFSLPIGIPQAWLDDEVHKPLDVRRFVFVGRYERRKGTEELTKVLKELLKTETFHFDFIGNIPKENQIKNSQIHYWGLIKEEETIQRILSESDVLVCPSFAEGMPTVILEGMARGCAIIATDVGAVCEVVNHEIGWLIEKGDSFLLKSTIQKAIKLDENTLHRMQKMAHQKVTEKFIWEKVIQKMITGFLDILTVPSSPVEKI